MKKITFLLALLITVTTTNAQINESFEGEAFPPAGWVAFTDDDATTSRDYADVAWEISSEYSYYGGKSAYSGWYNDILKGWLVTPQFTPTSANHMLNVCERQFDDDDDYESVFTVRVSTASQTTLSDFTIIDTQVEDDFNEIFSLHSVDLTTYIDQPIYIAFVHHTHEDGDNWYIDEVSTETLPIPNPTTNPTPNDSSTDIEIINSQTSVIDFDWNAPTTGSTPSYYTFYLGADSNALVKLGSRTVTDAHPSTFHFNTTYYWKAAAGNTSGEATDSEVWNFTTVAQPTLTAPYIIDFENNGTIPDACDQLITNNEFWRFTDDLDIGHIGNNGDTEGTSTASGGYFAFVDDSTPNSNNTSFLTPFIDVSGLTTPAISFYIISNNEGSTNSDFSVEVWDGTAWNSVYTSNSNTAGWEKKIIDLSSLTITDAIQAKFIISENVSEDFKDDVAIDDIHFNNAETLGIQNEEVIDGLSFYPNPINDQLIINSLEPIDNIQIFNLIGQCVLQISPKNTHTSIETSNLSTGNYIVKVTAKSKHNTFKLIKE
jgi:hypothetical protein